ncbi:MAG TPA: beta-eliminating lyase-related protein [Frankiaceae bacterium]|nr:beta-eliminating lyase-related protein [Frankiaceae bacterium]
MSSAVNFASDNQAGVHPEVLAAVVAANEGSAPSYGGDPITERAEALFGHHFGPHSTVQFAFTGTGANVIGLQAMLRPYESVLCAATAHISTDECGAPERFLGSKLIGVPTPDGKLTPELLAPFAGGVGDQQHAQPRVVSLTESTELGTVYELEELRRLGEWAHARGMLLHVDGARICNAAAALDVGLDAFASVGIDVLSFGATKNGGMGAEAVVYLDDKLATGSQYIRKQATQLASKMRFLSAQFVALLDGDLWWRNAVHANAMAARLAAGVGAMDGVRICHPVQANGVFAELDPAAIALLQERFRFHVWDEIRSQVRWMTSFDTTPDDVDAFVGTIAAAVEAARSHR